MWTRWWRCATNRQTGTTRETNDQHFPNSVVADSHFAKKEKSHRDGLGKFSIDVPAGLIAVVREEGVDAFGGLLRLHRINAIFGFAAFVFDGENAKGGDGFEGIAGLGVGHSDANGDQIPNIDDCKSDQESDKRLLDYGANRNQAVSSSNSCGWAAGRLSRRSKEANRFTATTAACLSALRRLGRS